MEHKKRGLVAYLSLAQDSEREAVTQVLGEFVVPWEWEGEQAG